MPFLAQSQIRFFRSLCDVTTGVPSPAKANELVSISPLEMVGNVINQKAHKAIPEP